MGLFEAFEKLINEHGSATILQEHLRLLKAQQAALQARHDDAQAQLQAAHTKIQEVEVALAKCRSMAQALTDSHATHRCDACGSAKLRRTGNRPHPTFGAVGIKEAGFVCEDCAHQSWFELPT